MHHKLSSQSLAILLYQSPIVSWCTISFTFSSPSLWTLKPTRGEMLCCNSPWKYRWSVVNWLVFFLSPLPHGDGCFACLEGTILRWIVLTWRPTSWKSIWRHLDGWLTCLLSQPYTARRWMIDLSWWVSYLWIIEILTPLSYVDRMDH